MYVSSKVLKRSILCSVILASIFACNAHERPIPSDVTVAPIVTALPSAVPSKMSSCGNGIIDPGERCDGNTGLPSPLVHCYPDGTPHACSWDFSEVDQLYCNGTCSWGGADGCDQEDADIFCKLTTGNPRAYAVSFQVVAPKEKGGFPCLTEVSRDRDTENENGKHPKLQYGKSLGPLPEYGVAHDVPFQSDSLLHNHGGGIVVTDVVCR